MQIKIARNYSSHYMSARLIRDNFLNYFVKEHEHKFIRSSPVVPFCDKSIAFVNAGMNQFKNIFLGKSEPAYPRAVNTQKCIRVGGKHNDLNIVGTDGYHHTFFEMLGNWSFGDYFKKEACTFAYNLLTGPYKIDPNRLYVTYFEGDPQLGIEPDLETVDIWRSIGIPKDRILPFGKSDNFWEMGNTGPCGVCTEIHYDHISTNSARAKYVNQGLPNLTELWNIVFIQYNRNENGNITELPLKHIDTGMGFERLVAILQGKSSNYDTDLFTPIFDVMQKECKNIPNYSGAFSNDVDRDYRIVADHGRMITACIADGMFPDHNHKLRRVLRKVLLTTERTFKSDELINVVVAKVVEILGDTFPEMQKLNLIHQVINYELEVYKSLRKDVKKALKNLPLKMESLIEHDLFDYPGFTVAYKDMLSVRDSWKIGENGQKILPSEYAFKLYDTYGLDPEAIDRVCRMENYYWNRHDLYTSLQTLKVKSKKYANEVAKEGILCDLVIDKIKKQYNVNETKDTYKYNYTWNSKTNEYSIPNVDAKVLAIIQDCKDPKIHHVVTNNSNFYYESGGQQSDIGNILTKNSQFNVLNVSQEKQFTIHSGYFLSKEHFSEEAIVELEVDRKFRTGNIKHHTATHLLNAVVRVLFNVPTCQKSSTVQADHLKLELTIYDQKLGLNQYKQVEETIRDLINRRLKVSTKIIDSQELLGMNDVTLVPGEVYPDTGLRLIEISDDHFGSKELCCGTHALNTVELSDFCITNVKLTSRASYVFTAVIGDAAQKAHELGEKLLTQAKQVKHQMTKDNIPVTQRHIKDMQDQMNEKNCISFVCRQEILKILNEAEYQCRKFSSEALTKLVEIEIKNLADERPKEKYPFIVHYLECSSLMESVPLVKAAQYFEDRPVMMISYSGSTIKAVCCVPKEFQSSQFNAKKWLQQVCQTFKSTVEIEKGASTDDICSMKEKRMNIASFQEKLEEALINSNDFAEQCLFKKSLANT